MSESTPDDDATRAALLSAGYETLSQRITTNNDILWRIIAFTLAAEVTAYVGLFQVPPYRWLRMLLGCAIAGMGIIGPITTRYVETILLMDRLLLDRYERAVLSNQPELRQHHAERMVPRVQIWQEWLEPAEAERLAERRFGSFERGPQLNGVLDVIGQPSYTWTAIIALGGAVGFDLGVVFGAENWAVAAALIVTTNAIMFLLWLLASGGADRWRIRRSTRKGSMDDASASWWRRPTTALVSLGVTSVVVILFGLWLYSRGANPGDKGSSLGVGLVTGGIIAVLVFLAEYQRERLNRARERRQDLRSTGAPPLKDAPPADPHDEVPSGAENA